MKYGKRINDIPEYGAFLNMRARCNNPNHHVYSYYGGRGIKVCNRWRTFDKFIDDMGWRPSPQHSIDRIDNNGNYTPENCRWATKSEQAKNRRMRCTNTSGYTGVNFFKRTGKWTARVQVEGKRVFLGYFDSAESAAKARKKFGILT